MENTYVASKTSKDGDELLYLEYVAETETGRARVEFSYSAPDLSANGYFSGGGVIIHKVIQGKQQLPLSDFDCGRLGDMCVNARDNLSEKWHKVLGGWLLEERI